MTIVGSRDQKLNRRLRLGMVGGGRGAFIGAVHRIASRIDDRWEPVAGAPSSDAERARLSGEDLGLAPDRVYGDFREMARAEAARGDGSGGGASAARGREAGGARAGPAAPPPPAFVATAAGWRGPRRRARTGSTRCRS